MWSLIKVRILLCGRGRGKCQRFWKMFLTVRNPQHHVTTGYSSLLLPFKVAHENSQRRLSNYYDKHHHRSRQPARRGWWRSPGTRPPPSSVRSARSSSASITTASPGSRRRMKVTTQSSHACVWRITHSSQSILSMVGGSHGPTTFIRRRR